MGALALRAVAAIVAAMAVLPVALPPAPASADGSGLPFPAGQRVQPPPDPLSTAELLSQDLTVSLHPENRSISAEGSLRLRACTALSRITLYLHETLDLVSIAQYGEPLQYTRNVERLTIDLATALAANATTNLSFRYNGTMWHTEGGLRQDCVGWEGAYLKGSTFWYLRHHASDWFDCRLKISCPPNWTAVADGELEAEEHTAEWANYTWVNDLPCLRPALAAGNYTVASRTVAGTNLSVYTYPQHAGLASGYLDEAAGVMQYLGGILGPYGRKGFKIVETAHETMMGYACSGFVMLHPSAFTGSSVNYGLLAHEAGHMWFPYATGYQGWAYPWLWEAFPEYLACLYEMERHGGRARLDRDYNAYVAVHDNANIRAIRASDWDTPFSFETIYAKGAWVLRMLHGIVGDARFRSILGSYVQDNLWAYGSAAAFISSCAAHSPVDLDHFWDQWLNTTRALDVSLEEARQYENGTSFRLELRPSNLLCATNLVDIKIECTDGTSFTVDRGWDGRSSPVVLDLPAGARQAFLDPGGWLLDVDRSNQAAVPLSSGKLYELRPEPPCTTENLSVRVMSNITAVIINDGEYPASGVGVQFILDGRKVSAKAVDIPARGRALASLCWGPDREGLQEVSVLVDPDDAFHEWDETNNNATATVEVAPPPPRRDVVVEDLSVPAVLMEGREYALNVTVRNAGDTALGRIAVEYLLDGTRLGRRDVDSLAVGEARPVSLYWTARRGHHDLSVRADPDGLVDEADEENNFAIASLFVRWQDRFTVNVSPPRPLTLEPVTFSVEGDAEEFRYGWNDGAGLDWTAERVVVHTYAKGGVYRFTVNGRAAGVPVGDAYVDVVVSNRPPEVTAFFDPPSPLTLSPVVFSVRTLDLDGTVLSVSWDLGDGTKGKGNRVEHQFSRPGSYTVRCTAFDDGGGNGTASLTVAVGNRPPVIGWTGPMSARAGDRLELWANASDPDGRVALCRWDFGDGSSADGENVTHAFRRPGLYVVTVTVQDDLGASVNRSGNVEVRARPASGPPSPDWIWLAAPVAIAGAAVAAATFLVLTRRRASRQRDDFFRPPPRRGQNQ